MWIILGRQVTDMPRPDAGQDTTGRQQDAREELVDELQDRLRFVERQLEAERQAHAEARRIIGRLVQRIPELEPPREAPAPSQTASEAPQTDAESEQAPGGADVQKTSEAHREPWYKRWFG